MVQQPLGEIFGFPADNRSTEASTVQDNRRCPFKGGGALCNKSSKADPIGVCSVIDAGKPVITCPVRFSENWLIARDAADFFFPAGTRWKRLPEVRMQVRTPDNKKLAAGNIDIVLAAYDDAGTVIDFGTLEIQAVYISGAVKPVFKAFMSTRHSTQSFIWTDRLQSPSPDWLSSSRKRLMPQLLYKGAILKRWGKKQAVAVQQSFYDTLPALDTDLTEVPSEQADMVWLIYDLELDGAINRYTLVKRRAIYTAFEPTLELLTVPPLISSQPTSDFLAVVQKKLNAALSGANLDAELDPNEDEEP